MNDKITLVVQVQNTETADQAIVKYVTRNPLLFRDVITDMWGNWVPHESALTHFAAMTGPLLVPIDKQLTIRPDGSWTLEPCK